MDLKKKKSTDHQIVYPPNKLHILEIGFKLRFSSLRQFFRTHKSINFNEKKNKTKIIKVPISPNLFHLMQMSSDFECIHSVSFSLFLDTQMSLGNGRMESVSCRYSFFIHPHFCCSSNTKSNCLAFCFQIYAENCLHYDNPY